MDASHRTLDVSERCGVEEELHQLGDRPVAPFEKQSHVRALPDELFDSATAIDDLEVVRVAEQLQYVPAAKGVVRLGDDQQIPTRFFEAAANGGAVALHRLVYLAGRRLRDLLARAPGRVVVDDDDLIDHAGGEELFD